MILPWGASLGAQQPLSLADAALQGQTLFQQSGFSSMVLVVVRDRETMIKGYGETFPGSARNPDSRSLIRLCSLSKVFATDLLLRLAADGSLSLADPLERYAPPGKHVPRAADGTEITLRDLATHTAGLPREVGAYPAKAPHFTFPSYTVRWAWLQKQQLITPPGTAALYSNVGFDFLGDALAIASSKSYAQLLHDRLLQPLGMWDTTLVPSFEQCSRLLRGPRDEGPCTDTLASGASGGIYSTPADMAKFLQYLLQIPGSPAQPSTALGVALEPQQLKTVQGLSHAGDPTGIGLAWIQIGDPSSPSSIIEKTGGGAGFSTYIALSPSRHTAVFVAVTENKDDWKIDLFHEGNNLLAALAGVPPLPPKVHTARPARKPANRRPRAHPSSQTPRPKSSPSASSRHRPRKQSTGSGAN
ncbi:MAG: D-alanyl-D-alanine-carboxypeptidase/endopeptidase AmpH [Terracidiphilus sp.]|jgi:D-alanyl-D-alanine-carboxypeptidase/D-alanyl-D-alanine-endopeptidase